MKNYLETFNSDLAGRESIGKHEEKTRDASSLKENE